MSLPDKAPVRGPTPAAGEKRHRQGSGHSPPLLLSLAAAARDSRLFLRGLTVSPIHGTNGNVEYLAAFSRRDALDEDETAALVAAALAEQPDE